MAQRNPRFRPQAPFPKPACQLEALAQSPKTTVRQLDCQNQPARRHRHRRCQQPALVRWRSPTVAVAVRRHVDVGGARAEEQAAWVGPGLESVASCPYSLMARRHSPALPSGRLERPPQNQLLDIGEPGQASTTLANERPLCQMPLVLKPLVLNLPLLKPLAAKALVPKPLVLKPLLWLLSAAKALVLVERHQPDLRKCAAPPSTAPRSLTASCGSGIRRQTLRVSWETAEHPELPPDGFHADDGQQQARRVDAGESPGLTHSEFRSSSSALVEAPACHAAGSSTDACRLSISLAAPQSTRGRARQLVCDVVQRATARPPARLLLQRWRGALKLVAVARGRPAYTTVLPRVRQKVLKLAVDWWLNTFTFLTKPGRRTAYSKVAAEEAEKKNWRLARLAGPAEAGSISSAVIVSSFCQPVSGCCLITEANSSFLCWSSRLERPRASLRSRQVDGASTFPADYSACFDFRMAPWLVWTDGLDVTIAVSIRRAGMPSSGIRVQPQGRTAEGTGAGGFLWYSVVSARAFARWSDCPDLRESRVSGRRGTWNKDMSMRTRSSWVLPHSIDGVQLSGLQTHQLHSINRLLPPAAVSSPDIGQFVNLPPPTATATVSAAVFYDRPPLPPTERHRSPVEPACCCLRPTAAKSQRTGPLASTVCNDQHCWWLSSINFNDWSFNETSMAEPRAAVCPESSWHGHYRLIYRSQPAAVGGCLHRTAATHFTLLTSRALLLWSTHQPAMGWKPQRAVQKRLLLELPQQQQLPSSVPSTWKSRLAHGRALYLAFSGVRQMQSQHRVFYAVFSSDNSRRCSPPCLTVHSAFGDANCSASGSTFVATLRPFSRTPSFRCLVTRCSGVIKEESVLCRLVDLERFFNDSFLLVSRSELLPFAVVRDEDTRAVQPQPVGGFQTPVNASLLDVSIRFGIGRRAASRVAGRESSPRLA
uniref:Protein kinase domain-containing protein n=1 Tax=Macrostomum lignano TaxID=282301 RepID=A0A1I8FSB9_9PLAT